MYIENEHVRYDGLTEIGLSLGWREDSIVAILRFYGDAGGTRDKSNIAVAGYIATLGQWNTWKSHWKEVLLQEGVECFHRSEMEPPFFGEFREKNWTKEHQVPVLNQLHGFIKQHTIRGVGHSVQTESFRQIMPEKIKDAMGGPYGWGVQLCVVDIGSWARERDDWVHYVFEFGDYGQEEIKIAFAKLSVDPKYRELFRIASWSVGEKKGPNAVIELQAADFLAYESYKQVDDLLTGSERGMRRSADDLVRKGTDELGCWTDQALHTWVAKAAKVSDLSNFMAKESDKKS